MEAAGRLFLGDAPQGAGKPLDRWERKELVCKFLDDVGMEFSTNEIMPLIDGKENQSMLLNELVRMISEKIYQEVGADG